MTPDADPAAAARAARLREQIEEIRKKATEPKNESGKPPEPEGTESPREFIQRRMRELDGKAKG
jgi:hypothetical protein